MGQLGQLGTSNQARNGKPVPYISHLIAGLLHDSIKDGGQSQASIAERFGRQVAAIVVYCTDTAEGLTGAGKEAWLVRKTRYVAWNPHSAATGRTRKP